jgi:hypothetical protein
MIIVQYQRLFNDIQYDYISDILEEKRPLLEKYHSIQKQLESKIAERKSLLNEKKSYSPLQVVKIVQISAKISALTEDIEELKNDKAQLLTRLECSNDKDVKALERKMTDLNQTQTKLKDRQSILSEQTNADKTKYSELQDHITLDNWSEVRNERRSHRDSNRLNIIYKLKELYGEKFSRRLFDNAEKVADSELKDKQFSREELSLHEQLHRQSTQERTEQHQPTRKKRFEPEL